MLIAGLGASQVLPRLLGESFGVTETVIRLLTMFCLSFIMIHVGYEFEIDKSRLSSYTWDYVVAATAAAFPWIFCACYFVFVLEASSNWWTYEVWRDSLITARFSSPTSAGVLFSMLAAAGLAATWVFQKARVLAIFDDLDTVLLMIPLKMMMVGVRWQLGILVLLMAVQIWLAWRYLHVWKIPITWPWVFFYAAVIVAVAEGVHYGSALLDDTLPIHLEVLLPAFVLGCMMARPAGADPHSDDMLEEREEGPESPEEQRVATYVSASFMVLVGLSMPLIKQDLETSWGVIALHVLLITIVSNIGKMFPAFCYRKEASFRERLALSIGMFPRGEVGAGVLIVSLSYGISGTALTIAMLSLALNLVLTGFFIMMVKRLIAQPLPQPAPAQV
ncbi:MAG TPA: sodium:proton antiporter [Planctomycetota bacterium]|nr:sodium:proton antiporter [Planctomycetota bacterium]